MTLDFPLKYCYTPNLNPWALAKNKQTTTTTTTTKTEILGIRCPLPFYSRVSKVSTLLMKQIQNLRGKITRLLIFRDRAMPDPWDSECELMPHGCLELGGGGGGHCLNWLIYQSRVVVSSEIGTLRNQDGDVRHKTVGNFQKPTA